MSELQDIIDAMIVIQQAMTPPTGLKGIQQFTDEPPASIGVLPSLLNGLEGDGESERHTHTQAKVTHRIDMHLLFSQATKKYPRRQARAWLEKVMNAFPIGGDIGSTVRHTSRLEYEFDDSFAWGESLYDALSFVLEVEVDR